MLSFSHALDSQAQLLAQPTFSKFSWALWTQPTNSNGNPLCCLSCQPLCSPLVVQMAVITLVGLRSKVTSSRKAYLSTPCIRVFLNPSNCSLSQYPVVVYSQPWPLYLRSFSFVCLLIDAHALHCNKARWDRHLVLLTATSLEARTIACT